jgi:alpha-ketoglutarate-dependent 2,4-dichlorophenoxyacetate dioxygenase
MRAAYDALDERTRAEVQDLVCEHSLIYSRGAIGFTKMTAEEKENFRPVRHSLVRKHPRTGRKSLRDLTEHATQRAFVYSHVWRPNDLVMWDNRVKCIARAASTAMKSGTCAVRP